MNTIEVNLTDSEMRKLERIASLSGNDLGKAVKRAIREWKPDSVHIDKKTLAVIKQMRAETGKPSYGDVINRAVAMYCYIHSVGEDDD